MASDFRGALRLSIGAFVLGALASVAACGEDAGSRASSSGGGGDGGGANAGATTATGGACDDSDRPTCVSYKDCCPGHDCLEGLGCIGDCDPSAACTSSSACCFGQFCVDGACSDACGEEADGCSISSDCCNGECHDNVCTVPDKGIGDPCEHDWQCISDDCNTTFGWCTKPCGSTSDCEGSNELGNANVCMESGKCAPSCESNADCAPFTQPGCGALPGIDGPYVGLCAYANTNPTNGIGDACTGDFQCLSSDCVGWCGATCSTNQDCGINEFGQLNWCMSTQNGPYCFPGCSVDADCVPYGFEYVCKDAGNATVCSLP